MLLAGVLVSLAAGLAQGVTPAEDTSGTISYVVAAPMVVRAEPSATSKVVGRLERFDLPSVVKGQTGWALVRHAPERGSSGKEFEGWIQVPTTDVEAHLDNLLDAALRVVHAKKSTW